MKLQEKATIIQAFVNGAEIEFRCIGGDTWQKVDDPSWDWALYEYRVGGDYEH